MTFDWGRWISSVTQRTLICDMLIEQMVRIDHLGRIQIDHPPAWFAVCRRSVPGGPAPGGHLTGAWDSTLRLGVVFAFKSPT